MRITIKVPLKHPAIEKLRDVIWPNRRSHIINAQLAAAAAAMRAEEDKKIFDSIMNFKSEVSTYYNTNSSSIASVPKIVNFPLKINW